MTSKTASAAPDTQADAPADRAAHERVDKTGARWTTAPNEKSGAEAIYCPVLEAGRWNGVMQGLHQRDPGLARRWRDSKHQPGATNGRRSERTKVLALARSETLTRWVLNCYEGENPGSGIRDAARYAERSYLRQLAIDGRVDAAPTSDEARTAIAAARDRVRNGRGPRPVGARERTDVRTRDTGRGITRRTSHRGSEAPQQRWK